MGAAAGESRSGADIYRQMCARCHGPDGEGTKKHYAHPLTGKKSLDQLTRYIAKSMPEDDPGKCTGKDAEKVAAYIFDAFYSPIAQARRRPPRIELARLTVRQYRNAVTDLIGAFRGSAGKPGMEKETHGLRGEYFNSRPGRFRRGEPTFVRVDPMIRLDLGASSPDSKKLTAPEFSIRWEGGVQAPETGAYEFIVRTEQSARLWVNDLQKPLIDASVKSGNETEYRGEMFLLGGRGYPLRLEFFRRTLGVRKEDKGKKAPIKASITLEWKLAQQPAQVIPQRYLTPVLPAPTFVLRTPFPADDRSAGYERGSGVSKAWVEATTQAALEVAEYVGDHLQELAGVNAATADRKQRLRDFSLRFAERAFRRPLTDEQKRVYVNRHFESPLAPETAVKRVVLLVLTSPRFLYREARAIKASDAYDVAARLSFGLWDSLPDPELLNAAATGQLATRAHASQQAERMHNNQRTHAKLREFFLQWLKVDQAPELNKDPKRFPGFDRAAASDLRASLDLFLDDILWSERSDFRELLLAEHLYLNGRLAPFYGVKLAPDAPFQKVSFKSGERAGVLTHPYLMAAFSYPAESSPIHRGVFLARNVLGVALRPPPDAFAPLAAKLHPELTTRERVALQTKPQACQSCHGVINPLGFTLENFDAIGRYREKEKDRPIDATGAYQTRRGNMVHFGGIRDLAHFLARSEDAQEAFVEQLFHYLVKQPIPAYGAEKLAELRRYFADNQYSVRKLVVEITAGTALVR
jgi:mono/diheme cytochrome c family protein